MSRLAQGSLLSRVSSTIIRPVASSLMTVSSRLAHSSTRSRSSNSASKYARSVITVAVHAMKINKLIIMGVLIFFRVIIMLHGFDAGKEPRQTCMPPGASAVCSLLAGAAAIVQLTYCDCWKTMRWQDYSMHNTVLHNWYMRDLSPSLKMSFHPS